MKSHLRELTEAIRCKIAMLRISAANHAWLMPERLSEIADAWRTDVAHSDEMPGGYFALVATLYYGPEEPFLASERWNDVLEYISRWSDKRFSPSDQMQLVFCYGLGVARGCHSFGDGTWANRWDNATWSLHEEVMRLTEWVSHTLGRCGIYDVENAAFGHTVPILLGDEQCPCEDHFLANHPQARLTTVRERHMRHHLIESWLTKRGWPENYRERFYSLSRFVFRAVVGDRPQHTKDFEKGILFPSLQSHGRRLKMVQTLTCKGADGRTSCDAIPTSFRECKMCGESWPTLSTTYRLILEGDSRWRPLAIWRCRECSNLCSAAYSTCERCAQTQRNEKPDKRRQRKTVVWIPIDDTGISLASSSEFVQAASLEERFQLGSGQATRRIVALDEQGLASTEPFSIERVPIALGDEHLFGNLATGDEAMLSPIRRSSTELCSRVRAAVAELPKKSRAILDVVLEYLEDGRSVDVRSIAADLELPMSTAHERLGRAMAELRDLLWNDASFSELALSPRSKNGRSAENES